MGGPDEFVPQQGPAASGPNSPPTGFRIRSAFSMPDCRTSFLSASSSPRLLPATAPSHASPDVLSCTFRRTRFPTVPALQRIRNHGFVLRTRPGAQDRFTLPDKWSRGNARKKELTIRVRKVYQVAHREERRTSGTLGRGGSGGGGASGASGRAPPVGRSDGGAPLSGVQAARGPQSVARGAVAGPGSSGGAGGLAVWGVRVRAAGSVAGVASFGAAPATRQGRRVHRRRPGALAFPGGHRPRPGRERPQAAAETSLDPDRRPVAPRIADARPLDPPRSSLPSHASFSAGKAPCPVRPGSPGSIATPARA